MYSENVMERFKNPKYAGELEHPDAVGEVGNIACGDIMRVAIMVKDNRIADIKFKTYGCVAAIASSDCLCEIAKGKTLDEALKITNKDVIHCLGGDIPAIKVHCSVLAQDALKKAIEDFRKQHAAEK